MKIDVHCHVFNKDILSFAGKAIAGLGDIITDVIDNGNYDDANTKIERVNAFLETSQMDAGEMVDIFFQAYGTESIIVPLMYDMYYLAHDRKKDLTERLADHLKEVFDRFDAVEHPDRTHAAAIKSDVQKIGDRILTDLADDAIKDDCFETQIEDLEKLKGQFPANVFPFISFDPRRPGNLDRLKGLVGPNKTFHGVKLYTPLGFSAADPSMMGKKGLYSYCTENDIPITAHGSCPGMPTLRNSVAVPGQSWVFLSDLSVSKPKSGECPKCVNGELKCTPRDETVDFSRTGTVWKSIYFNHPQIWRKVLEQFPDLRLNLAHFGGDCSAWRRELSDMIHSGKYSNLYTDISCRTNPAELDAIRKEYDNSDMVKSRLMYGSDFTILLLNSDFQDFREEVEKAFPFNHHQSVYIDNARSFLKLS